MCQQDNGRFKDEDDRQQLDAFLDLAESVACVQPLHRAIHLQLGHAQIHRLSRHAISGGAGSKMCGVDTHDEHAAPAYNGG